MNWPVLAREAARALVSPRRLLCDVRWMINRRLVREVVLPSGVFHYYRGELYPDYLNHGDACSYIQERALLYCTGKGIDVGADKWPLPGAIPVRNEPHQNAYALDAFPDGSLDFVFSSHCLEHLAEWRGALKLWIRKLKPGGRLFLYLPHESMKLWRRGGPWVGPGHEWIPTWQVLEPFLSKHGVDVTAVDRGKDSYWSFYIAGKRRPTP